MVIEIGAEVRTIGVADPPASGRVSPSDGRPATPIGAPVAVAPNDIGRKELLCNHRRFCKESRPLNSCRKPAPHPRNFFGSFGLLGRWCGRVCVAALSHGYSSPALTADVLYSRTTGLTCQHFYEAGSIATHCRGPADYVAVIVDRNRVININYGRLSNGRLDRGLDRSDLLWRGAAGQFEDRIEWRVLRGQPFAAIMRIFTLTEDDGPLQQFLIAKVTPSGSCEIARINVLDANAHGTARAFADSQAPMVECGFEPRR